MEANLTSKQGLPGSSTYFEMLNDVTVRQLHWGMRLMPSERLRRMLS